MPRMKGYKPRVEPMVWKTIKLTQDTHCVLEDVKRDNETYSQVVTRLLLFYSELLYDQESEQWSPAEAGVCVIPVDMADFGVGH